MYPDQPVVTGEAVALDIRVAGMGSRGIAALIDFAVITVIEITALIVIIVANAHGLDGSNANGLSDAIGAELLVAVVGVTVGYPVALETLWRGRTIGKAVMGLRVVRDDGGPIRFRHALVRGLVGVVAEKPGPLLALPAMITMNVSRSHKRLGDMAAGTIVLQQRVPGRIEAPADMPPPLASWAASLDLTAIDDAFAMQIRQFMNRALELAPQSRTAIEHQLTSEVISRVGQPPPGTPAWALLAAMLAERRRRAFAHAPPPAASPPPPSYTAVPVAPPQSTAPPSTLPPNTPPQEPASPETTEAPASTTGFVVPS